MRAAPFNFAVPFTGRAVLENNRFSGAYADNPVALGPGVAETVEIR